MDHTPDFSRRRWLKGGLSPSRPDNRLPWSVSWSSFTDACTRCGDCISACPEQIVIKADGGFPALDFSRGECTLCGQCAEACAEPLFRPLTELPWQQQATFGDACLAVQGVHCRGCEDCCEPAAIRFRPRLGGAPIPELAAEHCNGCGACVSACPVNVIRILEPEEA